MAACILNEIEGVFDEEILARLAEVLNETEESILVAAGHAIGAVTNAAVLQSASIDGAEKLFRSVSEYDGSIYRNLSLIVRTGTQNDVIHLGQRTTTELFSNDLRGPVSYISAGAGVSNESAEYILHLIVPLTMDLAGEFRKANSLNRNGTTSYFEAQNARVMASVRSHSPPEELDVQSTIPVPIQQEKSSEPFTPPLKLDDATLFVPPVNEPTTAAQFDLNNVPTDVVETSSTATSIVQTAALGAAIQEGAIHDGAVDMNPTDSVSTAEISSVDARPLDPMLVSDLDTFTPRPTESTESEPATAPVSQPAPAKLDPVQPVKVEPVKVEPVKAKPAATEPTAKKPQKVKVKKPARKINSRLLAIVVPLLGLTCLWVYSLHLFSLKGGEVAAKVVAKSAAEGKKASLNDTLAEVKPTEPAMLETQGPSQDSKPEKGTQTKLATVEPTMKSKTELRPSVTSVSATKQSREARSTQKLVEVSTASVDEVLEPADSTIHPKFVVGFTRVGELRIPVFDGPRQTGRSYYSRNVSTVE